MKGGVNLHEICTKWFVFLQIPAFAYILGPPLLSKGTAERLDFIDS